jgi:hypothetical protein
MPALPRKFRFVYHDDYMGQKDDEICDNFEVMSAFYHYSEPFNAECRAFGRLKEADYEELAVPCYGYVLLDEEHERSMMAQFSSLELEWNGNGDALGLEDVRARFPGRDGGPPPIRGIVKAFGPSEAPIRARDASRVRRDLILLQQLGIFSIDIAHRQLIDWKIVDFSLAVTTPHFLTNPELNPRLTPAEIEAMELETFKLCINDYWEFDDMIRTWNSHHRESRRDQVSIFAFPEGLGCRTQRNLRSTPARKRAYTFVDPRRIDWREFKTTAASPAVMGRNLKPNRQGPLRGRRSQVARISQGVQRRRRLRLTTRPPRWYYRGSQANEEHLATTTSMSYFLTWVYKDGLRFPRGRGREPGTTYSL